ncbi:transcriptional regulatory protein DevR (DosR) [mine drainage metagenome]|uniref:Transcriptional regulatory protein DevR (DosR) n=1 Tax=mine drainage metagenome TaxID=410659 RepID=A0A1J5RWY0_9ZZZZ
MITIALAEDHQPTLKRFADYFKYMEGFEVVAEAVNGHDLILKINALQQLPDIVLIDINMPVIDGVAVTYYLKIHYPSVKLIGLSNLSDEDSLKSILLSGADGFVMKALAENVLYEAITTVLNNKMFIDKRMEPDEQQLYFILNKRKERIENDFGLTERERTFIILNATALSYEQIAATMFVESKTIQTYFDRISKKLSIRNRQALTIFSLQNGLAAIANYN